MAYAHMGGLVIAPLLTLVFLPGLYVARFRIRPAEQVQGPKQGLAEIGADPLVAT